MGGLGALWLLLLLGPLGWIALVVAAWTGLGRERLTVALPYTHHAWARYRSRRVRILVTGSVSLAAFALAVLVPPRPVWAAVAAAAFAVALVTEILIALDEIDIRLDASRRWVTLRGVHSEFARALADEARSAA